MMPHLHLVNGHPGNLIKKLIKQRFQLYYYISVYVTSDPPFIKYSQFFEDTIEIPSDVWRHTEGKNLYRNL